MEYAVVDIETTGSHSNFDKITEIAILIHNGKKVTGHFSTLINPETIIPAWISSLTGITNEMVADAPRFYEVAKEIYQLLDGKIFVAHNVNFDYYFIKEEFKSLGSDLDLKKLCTVRLSRKIFPGFPSYSLGNLCKSLNIKINDRHRAYGDAEATAKVLGLLIRNDKDDYINNALKRSSVEAYLPPNLPREQFVSLPQKPGVYYFFDKTGKVIYVGKANNIKSRIKGHFSPGSDTNKRQRMVQDIYGISYEICGNELISLLFEASEIKRLWPVYNRVQKRTMPTVGVFLYEDREGYKRFSISRVKKNELPIVSFRSSDEARSFMQKISGQFGLCSKFTGLQTSPGTCFEQRIGQCAGACIGLEKPRKYNKKVNSFLETLSASNISVFIVGKGRQTDESSVVWIEKGAYKGFGYISETIAENDVETIKEFIKPYPDNQDIQRILQIYLRRDRQYRIIPLNKSQSSLLV